MSGKVGHPRQSAGQNRDRWGIRTFLYRREMTMRQLSTELGVHYQQVQETVRGVRNDRAVLTHLRDMGCPLDVLDLPEDLKPQVN